MLALALLSLTLLSSYTPPVPSPFPAAASYMAHLRTTNRSKLCASCTFDGRHAFDSDRLYGHVAWFYGPNAAPRSEYVNFVDIFLGTAKVMFLLQDKGGGVASCTKIAPYPAPIFNASWASGARYLGTGAKSMRDPWPLFHHAFTRTLVRMQPANLV